MLLNSRLAGRTTGLDGDAPRGIKMTPDGQSLFDRSASSMRDLRGALRDGVDTRTDPSGVLRITTPHDIGIRVFFAVLLASFCDKFPAVRIELELGMQVEEFDVALRPWETVDGTMNDLRSRRVGTDSRRGSLPRLAISTVLVLDHEASLRDMPAPVLGR